MGNTPDKEYACDTLAREITFKRYSTGSDRDSSEASSSAHNSYDRAVTVINSPLLARSAVQRRKDLRNSFRRTKHNVDNKKGSGKYTLADMEVACDGNVCKLVPRDSAKRRAKAKKTSRSNSKRIASKPTDHPQSIPHKLAAQPGDSDYKPPLPPKLASPAHRLNNQLPSSTNNALPHKGMIHNNHKGALIQVKPPTSRTPVTDVFKPDVIPTPTKQSNSPFTEQNQLYNERLCQPALPPKHKSTSSHNVNIDSTQINNNKLGDFYAPKFNGLWNVDRKLRVSQEILNSHYNMSSTPDIAKCGINGIDNQFAQMRLVSPITDV